MDCRLILFDLDGTLLDDRKMLPEENAAALKEAASKGIEIVPATGRMFHVMPESVRSLPFLHYAITINGAEILDIKTHEAISRKEIPFETAERIFDEAEKLPVIYDCYQDDVGYSGISCFNRIDEFITSKVYNDMIKGSRIPLDDFRKTMRERRKPFQKIQMFFKDQDLRISEMKRLSSCYPELLFTSSMPMNIEINIREANKGTALLFLCRYLNIDVGSSAAFGDNINDIDMIKAAGTGIVMGNGDAGTKKAADFISKSNAENGVAYAMHELGII